MKSIQIITYDKEIYKNLDISISISDLKNPESLDDYDIDIIDISNKNIWCSKSTMTTQPDTEIIYSNDFRSIKKMIDNSKKAIIIVCLPQNVDYICRFNNYRYKEELKNIIKEYKIILNQLVYFPCLEIIYENSNTIVNNNLIKAAYHFNNQGYEIITKSNISEKVTTIKNGNIYLTTLDLFSENNTNNILPFINLLKIENKEVEYPQWLYEYEFNDDNIQKNIIKKAEKIIEDQKIIIEEANNKINSNFRYKSILFDNSDRLVNIVFEIIEYIFDVDLSSFVDIKNEDFLFKKNEYTYIGEIKGISTNVKNENISQVDNHCLIYLDKLQEENKIENIKKVLIINYERNISVEERNPIHHNQVDLSLKREVLIISTKQLLLIYQSLIKQEISKEKVIDYINNNNGVFNIDNLMSIKENI